MPSEKPGIGRSARSCLSAPRRRRRQDTWRRPGRAADHAATSLQAPRHPAQSVQSHGRQPAYHGVLTGYSPAARARCRETWNGQSSLPQQRLAASASRQPAAESTGTSSTAHGDGSHAVKAVGPVPYQFNSLPRGRSGRARADYGLTFLAEARRDVRTAALASVPHRIRRA
jgi:hypothetical protein